MSLNKLTNIIPYKFDIKARSIYGGEIIDIKEVGGDLEELQVFTGLDFTDVINPSGLLQIFNDAKLKGLIQDKDGELKCYAKSGIESKLNLRQYLQVRTQEFKDWFGDRQYYPDSASKVVDENGEPLVVYHGTDVNSLSKISYSKYGGGFFFSELKGGYGHNQYEVFLKVFNRKESTLDEISLSGREDEMNRRMTFGYDGLCLHQNGILDEISIFSSNQIKSASGNHGRFSLKTDNIYD